MKTTFGQERLEKLSSKFILYLANFLSDKKIDDINVMKCAVKDVNKLNQETQIIFRDERNVLYKLDVQHGTDMSCSSWHLEKVDETLSYNVYLKGGSIGEINRAKERGEFHNQHGIFVKRFGDNASAKSEARYKNRQLTDGEKNHYGMKYHVKVLRKKIGADVVRTKEGYELTGIRNDISVGSEAWMSQ